MTLARKRRRGEPPAVISEEIRACFAIIANLSAATAAPTTHNDASLDADRRSP